MLVGTSLLITSSCWAALGGNVASVHSDQQAWNATQTSTALTGATVYTLTLPNGVIVREFTDTTGSVFAVAWEGPVMPDFQRLLASFFGSYQEALNTQSRGVHVKTNALVIESGGRMRAFTGRAYLPTQFPAAISATDLR
jgi:hypothetical protein